MRPENERPVVVYHHRTQGVDAQGIHVREMCKAFEGLGCRVAKVSVYSEERAGQDSRPGLAARIIKTLPAWAYEALELGYNLVGIPRLYRAVRVNRPLFIYERYSLFNLCGMAVSRLTGTPLVLEVNSPLAWEKSHHGSLVLKRLAQSLETLIVNQAGRTVAVTAVLKDMLVRQGARPEKIVVMPNAVNLEEFQGLEEPDREPTSPVTLGFAGWFRPWHGLSEMLGALDDHGVFGLGARLLLVGDGPARPDVEKVIAERGLGQGVTITGPADRTALFGHLASMDIALQPAATAYASPMKLFEYLAAGKALVAPDQANIREVVRDGETALLFAPGDWPGLARRVRELILDADLRRRLGRAGRAWITENNRTWRVNAAKVMDMMSGHSPSGS
jgi:glycosyltransferase involved in cell wall biosynthesis